MLGLAIMGCGMAARPHARALKDLSHRIEVRGVFARRAERRAAFCAEHGFPEAESAEALASDPGTQAVLLITPPNARADLVRMFADNRKHVLSKKPLERTATAAEGIVAACDAARVALGVVFQHRFRAASEALAELLAEGRLGTVRMVRVDVPWWRDQSYYDEPGRGTYERDGGGVLISQAIHTLDLMLSMTGPVTEVQAMTATTPFHRMESEDFAVGALRFASGAVGSVFATTSACPGDAESLILDCERGTATLKSGVLTIRWREGGSETFGEETGTGGGADPMAFPHGWHRDLIADFAEAVETGRAPRVTGAQALEVHRLIAAIERSSAEGRRIRLNEA